MKIRMRTWVGISLMVATILTESHSFFKSAYPVQAEADVSSWFHIKPAWPVPMKWFIKFLTDQLLTCTHLFIICMLGWKYDKRICFMAAINFLYFVFDYYMFLYDYKLSYNAYYALLIVNISTCIFILIPENKKAPGEAKVIEL